MRAEERERTHRALGYSSGETTVVVLIENWASWAL